MERIYLAVSLFLATLTAGGCAGGFGTEQREVIAGAIADAETAIGEAGAAIDAAEQAGQVDLADDLREIQATLEDRLAALRVQMEQIPEDSEGGAAVVQGVGGLITVLGGIWPPLLPAGAAVSALGLAWYRSEKRSAERAATIRAIDAAGGTLGNVSLTNPHVLSDIRTAAELAPDKVNKVIRAAGVAKKA
jgi:hypothetical protein